MSNKVQGQPRVTSEAKRNSDNAYNARLKREAIRHYGGHCASCGYTGEALQLHHVNWDGAAHRAVMSGHGGRNLHIWLRRHNYPDYPVLRVLCASCHVEAHARRRRQCGI
jgi:ribosomal protein L37E